MYKITRDTIMNMLDRFKGCLLGLAVGDAAGVPFEFKSRRLVNWDGKEMQGYGRAYPTIPPGSWSDDTAMALCIADSITERYNAGLPDWDPKTQMENYIRWRNESEFCNTDRRFDIGGTVSSALYRYEHEEKVTPFMGSTNPVNCPNGSIMRLAPVPMRFVFSSSLGASMKAF